MAIEAIKRFMMIGHSFGITIPKNYGHALGLKPNDLVVLRLTNGKIEIIPYGGNSQCSRKG